MKNQSRGRRGKRLTSQSYGGNTYNTYKRLLASKNPLMGDYKKRASAEFGLKGASLFVGFSVNF